MADFSADPTARGFFAPDRFESTVFDCTVTGTVPSDLNGALRTSSRTPANSSP
jgi:carotenoid cleavage dioxygenase-like enzyme